MIKCLKARCHSDLADFRHMFWDCPALTDYWEEVTDTLAEVTDRDLDPTMAYCILHWFPHTVKTKITSKFIDLGLLLAKRLITIRWKDRHAPSTHVWKAELIKWAESEGTLRFQIAARTHSEKALDRVRA